MNHAEITCYRPSPRRKDEFAGKIIDYSAERPFAGWDEEILFECLKCALSGPKVNMEICSLVLREQKESGYDVSKSKAMMKKEKIDEILWLPGVWFRIRDLRDNFEFTKAGKKSCKVYFIILTETPNTA